jgi:hypothetical protein
MIIEYSLSRLICSNDLNQVINEDKTMAIEYSVSRIDSWNELHHVFSTTDINKVIRFLENNLESYNFNVTEYDLENLDTLGLPEIISQLSGDEWLDK